MSSTPDSDDSWAEFYREIGLEPEPSETPAAVAEPIADMAPVAEVESEEDEGEDGAEESAESDGPAGEEELNEDGTKKRRRRRRRRSKKKGPLVGGETAAEGDSEVAEEPLAEVYEEDGGPSPEASRELIANWDVPSWSDIVASLHRPSGR